MTPSSLSSTQPSPPPRGALGAISLLALLGFADSAYLTADHYFALPLPCTLLHGCEKVLTSSYAMVGPVPLAAFGVLYYLGVLFYALYLYTAPVVGRGQLLLLFAGTVVGLAASIVFESIQAFIIGAFCVYCLASAIDTVLLFGCGVWVIKKNRAPL